jgi:DnaJ like chaperone protein
MIRRVMTFVFFIVIPILLWGQHETPIIDFDLDEILRNHSHQKKKEEPTSILYFVFTFIGLGVFLYVRFITELVQPSKSDSAFTPKFPSTKRNIRYAYKVIGYYVLYSENDDLKGQYKYLVGYLRNLFPDEKKFNGRLFAEIRNEFDGIKMPVIWLRRVLQKDQYPQVIDFMIDLAYYNGRVSRRELQLIYQAGMILGLQKTEIQAILAMRQNHYKEQERQRRERSSTFVNSVNRSAKKNASLRILGLPSNTTDFQEVRKAYRNLARKYHPDRFVNTEKGEQKMAHDRFVQINNAHDYLSKVLSK